MRAKGCLLAALVVRRSPPMLAAACAGVNPILRHLELILTPSAPWAGSF